MRVVEPHSFGSRKNKKSNTKLLFIILAVCIGIISATGYYYFNKDEEIAVLSADNTEVVNTVSNEIQEIPKTGLRTFSGNEFRLLYDNYLLPNTEKVGSPPAITGDDVADARIRQLAETRGYRLRTSPSSNLTSTDGIQLQEIAQKPWKELQLAAKKAGLVMTLTSGYRSVEDQRLLFLSRLQDDGITISDVSKGAADDKVTEVLIKAAAPGYSKHHSGYTIDIKCEGWEFEDFKNSKCNDWLVANNYENAKLHGFIPSYPVGADLQGPDPEAWEYVFVGQEVLNY